MHKSDIKAWLFKRQRKIMWINAYSPTGKLGKQFPNYLGEIQTVPQTKLQLDEK